MDSVLSFLSWNVKGLNHSIKRRKVFSHIKQFKTVIAFLQETHIRALMIIALRHGGRGSTFTLPSRPKPEGSRFSSTKTFSSNNTVLCWIQTDTILLSRENSIIQCQRLLMYTPWMQMIWGFSSTFSHPCLIWAHTLILGGDFNCWLDPVLDSFFSHVHHT